jgi:hypothetical protein
MSDVIVTTTNSVTDVTTTDDVTNINITETVVEVSASTAGVQGVPGVNSDPIYVIVTNKTGVTLSKGAIVYTSGANGTHTQVSLANASADATSARTLGWVVSDILNNADGLVCVEGYIDGIDTQGITEGAQLYLSGTVSGGFTETKPQAPTHLVYVGICSKASAGNGRVYVKVQNGYELDELHNVKIVSPQNNDLLQYVSGTALWENVAATAVSVGSATNAGTAVFATTASSATNAATAITISGSITKSQVSDFTSGTVASASTAQQAGTAVYSVSSGSALVAGTADSLTGSITRSQVSDFSSGTVTTITGDITRSQVSDFASGTVTSASTAQTSGTAFYSTSSGSALVAGTADTISGSITKSQVSDFTSGTVTTISGTITRSQVSDYASGTVANISGTVSQSQVSNLVTDLAGKAGLADNNTFTGTNTFSNFTTFQAAADTIPIRVFGASGQSADLFSVNDYLTNTQFEILSDGRAQSLKGIIATVSSTASVPLVVRGTAGQSANLSEWQTSAGATAASLSISSGLFVKGAASGNLIGNFQTNTGTTAVRIFDRSSYADVELIQSTLYTGLQTYIYGAGDYGAALNVVTKSTAAPGLVVRARASQATALQQWQNSGGTTTSQISADGTLFASRFAYFGSVQTAGLSNAVVSVVPTSATNIPVAIRGAASQSADLLQIQNSSGGTVTRVDSNGAIASGNTILGQITSIPASTATKGLVIRGASGQSANLFEIQNSTPTTLVSVGNDGAITHNAFYQNFNNMLTSGRMAIGTSSLPSGVQLGVYSGGTANKGLVVQGIASQSANLQEWQNSGSTVIARVSSAGLIRSADNIQANALVGVTASSDITNTTSLARIQANSTLGGGWFQAVKLNAATSNIAVDSAQIYFRDGTNANTLKLVVKAGAGAEQTILDNIPTA